MDDGRDHGPRAAVLQAEGMSVRGVFDDRAPMVFLPHGSADFALAEKVRTCADISVCWVDELARFELPVEVVAVDRKRGEMMLKALGTPDRVQRRTEVRAPAQVRCTVMTFADDGVVSSPGTTINLSAGGAALMVDRDADIGGHADPPEVGEQVGMVLALPDRRVGAVATVLGVRHRASRTTLRVSFAQIHPSDSTAITRHVLAVQTRRSD
jgi:hypothetical protein